MRASSANVESPEELATRRVTNRLEDILSPCDSNRATRDGPTLASSIELIDQATIRIMHMTIELDTPVQVDLVSPASGIGVMPVMRFMACLSARIATICSGGARARPRHAAIWILRCIGTETSIEAVGVG